MLLAHRVCHPRDCFRTEAPCCFGERTGIQRDFFGTQMTWFLSMVDQGHLSASLHLFLSVGGDLAHGVAIMGCTIKGII